jgi:hypothetical protein
MNLELIGVKIDKKAQGTESPKINVVDEEEYFLDEESIDNLVDNFDDGDDEDYSPQSETRVTRRTSKFDEQKPKATYEAETTYKDSDASINSSGSIYKPTKNRIQQEDIGSEMKRKRLSSPMNPTHSIPATKATVGSQQVGTLATNPPFDRDFLLSMFKDFAADIDKKIAAIDKKCEIG